MSRRSLLALAAIPVAGLLAFGVSQTSAFASSAGVSGGNPQPCQTQTWNSDNPQPWDTCAPSTKPPKECPPGTVLQGDMCVPVMRQRLQQQEFDIQDANALPNGWVLGTGPISIVGGLDKQVAGNDRVDILESANGLNGVRINHEPLSGAQIDRRTCSVGYDQYDLPWSIHQGFGTFLGATGNGVYDLKALFSFPTFRNQCTLPWWLNSYQFDLYANGLPGAPHLTNPLAVSVDVQAVGRAAVLRVPSPCPTPTRSVFAPVNGQPSWTPPPTCE
jgi:hypothetical protein